MLFFSYISFNIQVVHECQHEKFYSKDKEDNNLEKLYHIKYSSTNLSNSEIEFNLYLLSCFCWVFYRRSREAIQAWLPISTSSTFITLPTWSAGQAGVTLQKNTQFELVANKIIKEEEENGSKQETEQELLNIASFTSCGTHQARFDVSNSE